jgi:hypothetical protein
MKRIHFEMPVVALTAVIYAFHIFPGQGCGREQEPSASLSGESKATSSQAVKTDSGHR